MNLPNPKVLQDIYGETHISTKRFEHLANCFSQIYHHEKAEFFTSPGRTEIIGNHTDHNGGKVLAASIDMDTIGAAYPNHSNFIRITSEGYEHEIIVELSNLNRIDKIPSTVSLVAGLLEGVQKMGFYVSGFDAYITTNVIAAAGVSSSASFEMLICSIINYFFNENKMTYIDYAKIGKYAENIYWKKESGMMDQMACAVGGTVLFDFSNTQEPYFQKINFTFHDYGYQLVIVNTGKNHADLGHEYSEIPNEMAQVAKALGVTLLHETTIESLLSGCSKISNDRAILRALHFFEENERVEQAVTAIQNHRLIELLSCIKESGISSWELLQNCYSLQNYQEQKVSLTLALSNRFLKKINAGVCRVHGGGFAGVIMCIIPERETENYRRYISAFVGEENVYPINIRTTGAVHIPCN
ncbi:MAG TPA: galactokinase [Candidatus Scybalomonas excrementigallinarum]|nr:galactokinase [Candidatus Scybalomonas excrementigallinarum]